jgi:glutathione S-transferase
MRGAAVDRDALARARQAIARVFDVMEDALDDRAYLAGEAFTLADVSSMPLLGMLFVTGEGDLLAPRPQLAAWWERVSQRPSWQQLSR